MSKKVRITADAVLAIVRGIFEDEDVNFTVNDETAPESWKGKTVNDILNVEYYTFKHRPEASQTIIEKIMQEKGYATKLEALNRSFCLLSLGNIERLYSKDVDMAVLSATLEYYVQTSKVKLLEYLIEDSNIETSGLRIPVEFGDQRRKAVVFFGRPVVSDIQSSTPFGEEAIAEVEVVIMLYPDVYSYSDYTVSVTFTNDSGAQETAAVPLSSFSVANVMTQDAVPYINNPRKVGNINLSCASSFVLVFEGYDNPFINHISDKSLNGEKVADNNTPYTLTVKRGEKTYTHEVVIKDHQMTTNADTGNETHTLTFTTKGVKNGSA